MTQPDSQFASLQQLVSTLEKTTGTLSDTVRELTRAIQGDAATGAPSLRVTIERLDDRVEALEQELRDQKTRLGVYIGIAKWAGGGSLITLAGAVAYLARIGGLHP